MDVKNGVGRVVRGDSPDTPCYQKAIYKNKGFARQALKDTVPLLR